LCDFPAPFELATSHWTGASGQPRDRIASAC
jgi:hypothetical protein